MIIVVATRLEFVLCTRRGSYSNHSMKISNNPNLYCLRPEPESPDITSFSSLQLVNCTSSRLQESCLPSPSYKNIDCRSLRLWVMLRKVDDHQGARAARVVTRERWWGLCQEAWETMPLVFLIQSSSLRFQQTPTPPQSYSWTYVSLIYIILPSQHHNSALMLISYGIVPTPWLQAFKILLVYFTLSFSVYSHLQSFKEDIRFNKEASPHIRYAWWLVLLVWWYRLFPSSRSTNSITLA